MTQNRRSWIASGLALGVRPHATRAWLRGALDGEEAVGFAYEGGIAMARELMRTGGDPRLKLLCVAIDHGQVGQVVRIRTLRA